MDKEQRNKLLDKYIQDFQEHIQKPVSFIGSDGGKESQQKDSKQYGSLVTKEDVMKILTEQYLKEYKSTEKEYVDEIFSLKTDVMNLRKKKKRLDTKTKELEKDLKPMLRELKKLQTKVRNKMKVIEERKDKSDRLNEEIVDLREDYRDKEKELKDEIKGSVSKDGEKDEVYYLKYFKMFSEVQHLFDGDKISISNLNTYPSYRMRFFGGKGTLKSPRNGFTIHGRYPKQMFDDLKKKLKRTPKKEDLLDFIIPQIQYQLQQRMNDGRFDKYLRRKTKPISSGYKKYKRVK